MPLFFTADHHFGHRNVIRYSARPFADVREMDEAMVERWNRVVMPTDTVYHLGDVSLWRPEITEKLLARLHGKICLIRGNHDKSADSVTCAGRFEWIKDYHFLTLAFGIKIALFHYALRTWDRKHYGAWHLYGHSHGKVPAEPGTFALDVGVDCWDFTPVSAKTIKDEMVKRGWEAKRGEV